MRCGVLDRSPSIQRHRWALKKEASSATVIPEKNPGTTSTWLRVPEKSTTIRMDILINCRVRISRFKVLSKIIESGGRVYVIPAPAHLITRQNCKNIDVARS